MEAVAMLARRSVVVGVSDAPANARTLAWAVGEAARSGSVLVVVRADVKKPEVCGAVARGSLRSLEIVDPTLARAVAAARASLGDERVTIVVDRDPPGELLMRHAERGDLVVLGAPRHAGWWARASTAYHAATHAPCPVVVVHEASDPPPPTGGHLFRDHVIVGVDGSPASRDALGFGFDFAAAHHRPLVAVTATRHLENDVWFDDTTLETHLVTDPDAAQALADELEPWHHKYPAVELKRALVCGSPADGLRRISVGAALLVVGTVGSGPAAMGSVSRALVERADCPVAIVRAGL
jgi:nucleotide-binding universal stress UspA family protein